MAEYREFGCEDMLRFNNVNLDKLTETVPTTTTTNNVMTIMRVLLPLFIYLFI